MSHPLPSLAERPLDGPADSWRWRGVMAGLLLLVLAVLPYLPALHGDFTWDDDQWLVDNAPVHARNGLKIIWNPYQQNLQFYPVTFTLLWLEHKCWGLVPTGYHAVNMLLHAVATLLLWLSLRRLKLRGAWLGALFWAIHPVQVDSVAWIAEIKNTLSAVFYFLAAWSYLRFEGICERTVAERPPRHWLFYTLSLLAFVAALYSKTVVCTLPAGLLVVIWWARGRLTWKSIAPLLPMFAIGLGVSVWASSQEHHVLVVGGAENLNFSVLQRLIICGKDVWFYVRTLAAPYPLMAIYPRWTYDTDVLWNYLPLMMLVVAVGGLVMLAWRGHRGPLAGALFFLVTLSPALGFINFFTMHYTFVADHYDYLACAGLLIMAAEGLLIVTARALATKVIIAVLVVAMIGGSLFYSSLFQTNMKLWTWNIAHNPAAYTAQHNLGVAYLNTGHPEEGVRHVMIALEQQPDDDNIQRTAGRIARDNGQFPEAITHLQRAIALRPRFGLSYKLLGDVYDRANDATSAVAAYAKAVEVDNTDPLYFIAYAEELKKAHQPAQAAAAYENAINLAPGNLITRYNYANLLLDLNKPAAAIEQYEFILKYQDSSRNGAVYHNLAYAYAQVNEREKAVAAEEHGRAIDAANAPAHAPATATSAP